MTQAQLDAVHFKLFNGDFESVFCDSERKKITCVLSENISIILIRINRDFVVIIEKCKKRIVLPIELFNCICDSKITVSFLKSYLEQE